MRVTERVMVEERVGEGRRRKWVSHVDRSRHD